MMKKITSKGAISFKLAGEYYLLKYDWAAIAALIDEFGQGFDETLGQAAIDYNLDVLATALSIGLNAYHESEGMSPERIKELSPPVIPTIKAINDAYEFGISGNGYDGYAEEKDDKPNPKKAGLRKRVQTWWLMHKPGFMRPDLSPLNSGV